MKRAVAALAALLFSVVVCGNAKAASGSSLTVTRSTLANGLQVVVIHDPLAPVVSAILNYRAGSNDQHYDGQAHALEHMMFRGSPTLSESQLSDIGELLGGDEDADTQAEVTQYFFTAPSQYLDLILRMESSRMRGAYLAQKEWNIERGAITNEVTQDAGNWVWRLLDKVSNSLYAGTPYGKNGLGTVNGFAKVIDHDKLKAFYDAWYHPNNAVYVIAGDVDGPTTIALVKKYFGGFSSAKLPSRDAVHFGTVKKASATIQSNLPVNIVTVSFRLPGWNSKDYAATQILSSVLNNQRSKLYDLVVSGKLLQAQVAELEAHPLASGTVLFGAIPAAQKPADAVASLKSVIEEYKKTGVPADLVSAEKRRALAADAYKANSIGDLAFDWSDAVAVRGLSSPDQETAAIQAVTVADVNAALRKYFDFDHALTVTVVPRPAGAPKTADTEVAKESNKLTLQHHDPLPAWAIAAFKNVKVPPETFTPADMTLSNGMRLIVVPQHVSHTVVVSGEINSNETIQAPKDVQGVGSITGGLLPFGTTNADRVTLVKQQDDLSSTVYAGTGFGASTLSSNFDATIAILADEELHPLFPEANFAILKQQEVAQMKGAVTTPGYQQGVATAKMLYPANDPQNVFETVESASAITMDSVKSYYASVFRPDMATVVVIGDVTPDQAKATFEKYFSSWKATTPKPDVFLPAVPNNKAGDVQVPDPTAVQSQVQLVQTNSLTRDNPDWATLNVMNAAFGFGGSSILFHDVRDLHGLVYGVGSTFDARKNRGSFGIFFASDPTKINAAQSLSLADLGHVMTAGMTSDDIARGKAMLVSQVPLRQQSFGGISNELIRYAQLELPLNQFTVDAQREIAVTNASIIAAVQKWIRPHDFVRVIVGPGPE